jgi:hypothetical protein
MILDVRNRGQSPARVRLKPRQGTGRIGRIH